MNRTTLAEIEQIKKKLPSKKQFQTSFFSISRTETGFEIEEIISNDFSHLVEAIMGNPEYLVADNNIEFDTIEAAAGWLEKRMDSYQGGVSPCLAVLGTFTQKEVDEISKVKKLLLINDKYLYFLFGLEVREEYRSKITD